MKKINQKILTFGFVLFSLVGFNTAALAQDHTGTIDLYSSSFKEFKVFGDTLDNYKVYFTGENHMYATFNTTFQVKFLKYLHQNQGVNHFIFEQSPGLSYIINKVILEDKTSHLHYLGDVFFDPFYELVKEIRKYNDTLPYEDKIQMHGIDIERFPSFSIYALDLMVDTLNPRVKGGEIFEQIKALATSDYADAGAAAYYANPDDNFTFQFGQVSAWRSLESIIDGANENKDSLKVALGKDSTIFYSIIESLEIGHEWYITEEVGDVKSPIIRERFMADEFERVYLADKEGKFYGQFGRCHLHKDQDAGRCYDYYMNSIANRINDIDASLDNQVLVIPIFYNKSRDYDKDVIKSLDFDPRFTDSNESYIIDLAYKNGDHPIVGFYNNLPFMIICNAVSDQMDYFSYEYWDNSIEEVHLGVGVGYWWFRKLNKLNTGLAVVGAGGFDNRMLGYTFYSDYFAIDENGSSFTFIYYPTVSNGDRFELGGFNATVGGSVPFGGRYIFGAFGMDLGYGQMKLKETQLVGDPILIQDNSVNKVIYRNDIFTLDPHFQFRITLPLISLNAKAGYSFDVSGKYWRLDGKAKDFTKTSFTAPYVQIGASLNFK
jgi:hypothetical protein